MKRVLFFLFIQIASINGLIAASLPEKISELNIYSSLEKNEIQPEFNRYSVNMPLWSDGLAKDRFFKIHHDTPAHYQENTGIELPIGSITVKEFRKNNPSQELIETRVMIRKENGWEGAAYLWSGKGGDRNAVRVDSPTIVRWSDPSGERKWIVPATGQCMYCHQRNTSTSLSFSKEQIFGEAAKKNTIQQWIDKGLLTGIKDIEGVRGTFPTMKLISASKEERARAYLAVNCSGCHSPTGTAPGGMNLSHRALNSGMNALFVRPAFGNLGITNAFRIAPRSKEQSILWERMRRTDSNRMPAIGSHIPHADAIELIGEWIDDL